MERIEIPNLATYSPFSLSDVMVGAPLAARLVLGATPLGRAVQAAAFMGYAGSALLDWAVRMGVRRVDFEREFGADVHRLDPMPREVRQREVTALVERLNDGYTDERVPRAELARRANRRLTDYLATLTGQVVETSSEIRGMTLAGVLLPFAHGACDIVSGDIAIFRDTGVFEGHILAHELVHRRGYFKELHAQVLAHLALATSGDPVLVQSTLAERLNRNVQTLAREDLAEHRRLVERSGLRPELASSFLAVLPEGTRSGVSDALRQLYDARMRLTGQNGLSDYWEGFTNFLWTFQRGTEARQPRAHARI
ncbi:MAG: hypothetical protein R3E98_19470 [Gemmatimonadota bacterium]